MSKKRIAVLIGARAMVDAVSVDRGSLTEAIYKACKEYVLDDEIEIFHASWRM